MEKISCLLFIVMSSLVGFSQDLSSTISKGKVASTLSIKGGILGLGLAKEFVLSDPKTLNVEFGSLTGSFSFGYGNNTTLGFPLELRVEPRHYYNIIKRVSEGRNVKKNSANFIGMAVTYTSDITIGNSPNGVIYSFVPNYGIRRMLDVDDRFYIELSLGHGIKYGVVQHAHSTNAKENVFDVPLMINCKTVKLYFY